MVNTAHQLGPTLGVAIGAATLGARATDAYAGGAMLGIALAAALALVVPFEITRSKESS
ncbi:hypothetical protein F4561_001403 [Lipingzhangella halophila]|uniref:Uncharacterized protein n=1 Tax=Lipingzhangella halophila TaxID=1783352 RepID=A0A7W7W1R6_9ACTN|nr:hypothetical protein [Lipingzhangella halophila]MBB4930583.1 hypothetical protein [Lipingzhangella halophila]